MNINTFQEMNLSPSIMRAITELGFTTPSAIQQKAFPILLGNKTDFIGLAATGTGKTVAFGVPLLERIDTTRKGVQVLILCPTRELALQVSGQINLLGKYLGVKALPVYGGASYGDQIYGLKRGDAIVVGTPGRVIDHIERGTLKLEGIHTLVLDEADEMISMGFKDELDKILSQISKDDSNTWLFSATMSREVRRVADTYLTKPQQVQINQTEMLSTTVEQIFYLTAEGNKPEVLCKLIDSAPDFYGIIFCQTKALVSDLSQYLNSRGYRVDSLHGDKDQNGRERTMQAFRDRRVNMLICTDVASRGLDVKDVTHVVNYSIPRELDSYVHRIGRTARSGKSGLALSLVTRSQRGLIDRIERLTRSKMKEGVIPGRKEVGTKKISALLPEFEAQKFHERVSVLFTDEWKAALSKMTPAEVAGRFLAMRFPDVFNDEAQKGLAGNHEEERSPRRRDDRGGNGGGHRGGPRRGHGGGGGSSHRGGGPRSRSRR